MNDNEFLNNSNEAARIQAEEEAKKQAQSIAMELDNYKKLYEDALKDKLGTKVSIAGNKIKISFVSKEDLNRILEILNVEVE